MLQHQPFEDGDVVVSGRAVRREVLRLLRVNRGRVDADQPHSLRVERLDEFGGEAGEVRGPPLGVGERPGAEEHARRFHRHIEVTGADAAAALRDGHDLAVAVARS